MDAIILAAGLSERMGRNKLLLPFGESTILNRVIEKVKPFADRIIVVTGHESNLIEASIKDDGIIFAFNENYKKGQKGSVLRGIKESIDDFFIIPGDVPMIACEDICNTIALLKNASAARCFFKDIPAHPVAFKKENREKILSYPGPIKNYLDEIGFSRHQGTIGSAFDADTSIRYESLLTGNPDSSLL